MTLNNSGILSISHYYRSGRMVSIGFIETYQATKDERYKIIAEEIFTYVLGMTKS
jgi:hypothetical protein